MSQTTDSHSPHIWPAERFILIITAFVLLLNGLQIYVRNVDIGWQGYGFIALASVGTFSGGLYYRYSGRSQRIGSSLVCTGLFAIFSASIVVFNYLLMPTVAAPIDQFLVKLDAMVGYHWPDVIAWAAEHPTLNTIVKWAYLSTIPQIAGLIIVLGMTGRIRQLHVTMIAITITSVIAVCFWGMFPSHGAKSLFSLPVELEMLANPVVTTEYGRDLVRMAKEGPGLIAPDQVKGLIAFPSYHAVLAFTAVYGMRGVKYLFPIYLVLNILIIPGAPLHGGHHLIDVPAGFILFVVGVWLAEKLVKAMYDETSAPELLPSDLEPISSRS